MVHAAPVGAKKIGLADAVLSYMLPSAACGVLPALVSGMLRVRPGGRRRGNSRPHAFSSSQSTSTPFVVITPHRQPCSILRMVSCR